MSSRCHRAEKIRQVLRRLVRRKRPPPPQSLPNKAQRQGLPSEDEGSGRRKKSPTNPKISAILGPWLGAAQVTTQTVSKHLIAEVGHLRPNQLTPLIADAIVTGWRRDHTRGTAYTYRRVFTQILRQLEAYGAPRITPQRIPTPDPRAIVLQLDELTRVLSDPAPWLRLFILLYLQSGLRMSEVLAVTPATWNREQHTVTVKIKGGRDRVAPVTPEAEHLFVAAGPQAEPNTPYIHLLHGRPISQEGIRDAWFHHKRKHGVNEKVTAHDLRRTAASIIYEKTKDLRMVQQLLGHKNLSSTLHYIAPLAPDQAHYLELLRFERFTSEVKQ